MKESSKILVTGGAGFIGSYLVNDLLAKGYKIVVLDNFSSGRVENVNLHLKNKDLKLIKGDIRVKNDVNRAMESIDSVIHLAALIDVEESLKNPFETHEVNVTGTLNVLNEAVKKDIKRFVYASTTAVYGEGNRLPLREDFPQRPISIYGASKASAEFYCETFRQCYGLQTVILRYFNVYGPKQKYNSYCDVMANFLNKILNNRPLVIFGDGEQTRDFVYIDDVVEATILALENPHAIGNTINICTGKASSINELVHTLNKSCGRICEAVYTAPRKGDIKDNYGDPTKVVEILGFRARINLQDGLERTIKHAQVSEA